MGAKSGYARTWVSKSRAAYRWEEVRPAMYDPLHSVRPSVCPLPVCNSRIRVAESTNLVKYSHTAHVILVLPVLLLYDGELAYMWILLKDD